MNQVEQKMNLMKEELEKIVESINQRTKSSDNRELLEKVDKILKIYTSMPMSGEMIPEIYNRFKYHIYCQMLKRKHPVVYNKEQNHLTIDKLEIRTGAWLDGSEDENNLYFYHTDRINKYVPGLTCGNLKYICEYPNQFIEYVPEANEEHMARKIYRYQNQTLIEIITIHIQTLFPEKNIYRIQKTSCDKYAELLEEEEKYYDIKNQQELPTEQFRLKKQLKY